MAFMPFITILQSMLDLLLHIFLCLPPLYCAIIGSLYFTGWLTQWSIWMDCEITSIGFDNAGKGETCFQVNLDRANETIFPLKSSGSIVSARVGLGAVVIALYATYTVLAALALKKNRSGKQTR
ncbi:MAG: hypothetical protein Q9222_001947 [Ikaeria aurantiellina]